MKIALVHDWLNQVGGAEDVLEALARLYPEAPIFTSIYDRRRMPVAMSRWDVRVSWMDRLPMIHRRHRPYLPLYPLAFERMRFDGYDVVLSNKSGFCHGIDPGSALHVCYCLTPTRYVWDADHYLAAEGGGQTARLALRPLLGWLRRWDREAARRVDDFVAISTVVQERILRCYGRESTVIFPPVDTTRFAPSGEVGDYYLSLGRLIPYKRVDLAVRACTSLGRPLRVAGAGRDRARLESQAGTTTQFLGRVPDDEVPGLMARCRAFIFPGLEDFGIAPVQAMAAGRPVIAFAGGGALDTVVDGKTGVLFREQTPESLREAIVRSESIRFDAEAIRAHAARFDTRVFERALSQHVAERAERHARSGGRREVARPA